MSYCVQESVSWATYLSKFCQDADMTKCCCNLLQVGNGVKDLAHVARGKEALTLLECEETRTQFLNELLEVCVPFPYICLLVQADVP